MPALHIMTFNLQLLPGGAMMLEGKSTDNDEGRADQIANDILALPLDERPDVLVFNEVFDEDSRKVLIRRLRELFPYLIPKLHDGGLTEDSGLMLFSQFPFLPLPTGGTLLERFYGDSEGDDRFASKGVGIVQLGVPTKPTTIAFTHLQASYESEDQYQEIRVKQLDVIFIALQEIFAGDSKHWAKTIILGDLNIRGDAGAISGEWSHIFEGSGSRLFGPMVDGWRTYMHPPNSGLEVDPGFTSLDFATRNKARLDYQCFVKREGADRPLVPHHMFTRLRNSSDHFGLSAIVQEYSPHCYPADAIDFLTVSPIAGATPEAPSSARFSDIDFQHEGSLQWLYVRVPGTYSIGTSSNVTYRAYAEDNLSDPLSRLDTLQSEELPLGLQSAFHQLGLHPEMNTFVSRTPFFIVARQNNGGTGSGRVMLLEHHGESPATAIGLRVHEAVESSFPVGQRLGVDDTCWFKALMPMTFSGAARTELFTVSNSTGAPIEMTIMDASTDSFGVPVSKSEGVQTELGGKFEAAGSEFIYLTIRRDNLSQSGFSATWTSPISYLMLDEPIGLHVDDESGVDSPGADEPELIVTIDNESYRVFSGTWNDADTGERWPDLDRAIRQGIQSRYPGMMKCGFVQGIHLTYVEPDMNAQGWPGVSVEPLRPSDPIKGIRQVSMPVPDLISDGRYTFYCTLTKLPY